MRSTISACLKESIAVKERILANDTLLSLIEQTARAMTDSLKQGGTVCLCGNGGSASDAQHIAGELVGRFEMERRGWPAVALSCDGAIMTSIMNDYGAERVFERQAEAYVKPGDVFIGISTSGNSENVRLAILRAKELGALTVGLLGKQGGTIRDNCDIAIVVPSNSTARIQESHITIGHILCKLVEEEMTK